MRIILILAIVFLTGCEALMSTKQSSVPDYVSHTYPVPEDNPSKCITGTIDMMINGTLATTIWYVNSQKQLVNLRLAHGKPLTIRFAGDTFCYDYFEVATSN